MQLHLFFILATILHVHAKKVEIFLFFLEDDFLRMLK